MESQVSIRDAKRGSHTAFRTVVEPLLPSLYRTAALIILDRDIARDAVQEALIRAYRSIGSVREEGPIGPWLHRLVINESLRMARKEAKRPLPLNGSSGVEPGESPEEVVLRREAEEHVIESMKRLSAHHRSVIVLRYYHELSESEMAVTLGIRPGTVKSRLHHARRLLERALTGKSETTTRRILIEVIEWRLPHA